MRRCNDFQLVVLHLFSQFCSDEHVDSLRAMDVRPGDIVAVQGIGGLGHLALQFSKAMGYRTVALSSSPAKKEMAHHLGATDYIDGSKVDQAQALLDLGGAKVIMVTAPNSEVIQSLMGGLCVGGQLLILALPEEPATVSLGACSREPMLRYWH